MTKDEFKTKVKEVFGGLRAWLTWVITNAIVATLLGGLATLLLDAGHNAFTVGIVMFVLQLGVLRPNPLTSMITQILDNGMTSVSYGAALLLRAAAAGVWFVTGAIRRGCWRVRRFFHPMTEKFSTAFKRKKPQVVYLLSYEG